MIASLALLGLALAATLGTAPAAAKGTGAMPIPGGIALPGSPFRYQTFSPGEPDRVTVVARINREGGRASRWWGLPGGWFVPGVTPSVATGLSADGSRLVLVRRPVITPRHPAPDTNLAIVRPQVKMRRTAAGFPHWVDFARLPGEWKLVAISPDGATLFLSRYRNGVDEIRPGLYAPHAPGTDDLEMRALDTASRRLLPGRVVDRDGDQVRLDGIAYDQVGSGSGRWTYTLFAGDRHLPYVYALDGVGGHGDRIDLRKLRGLREPYSLHLELEGAGRTVEVVRRWFPEGRERERTLARIDTATHVVSGPEPRAQATGWLRIANLLGLDVGG
ncbi:MAG: hypothetical protein QOE75_506 [Solirubrobacterales bacterium]|nr:hypothetical protein [Solirubrobacterales bacterium]